MMNSKLVAALLVALCGRTVEAKLYADGACPLYTLLPFTSMYVVVFESRTRNGIAT